MWNKIIISIKERGLLGTLAKMVEVVAFRLRWNLLRVVKAKTMRSTYGPTFCTNFEDATFCFYIRGDYGKYLSSYIKSIRKPFIFIDIGANQGLYALLADTNPHCKRIYAFEPVSRTYELLCKNITLNSAKKVVPLKYAISDVTDQKQIHVNPKHTGGATMELRGSGVSVEQISCVSSQAMEELLKLDEGPEIFVKIDTEGHEPTVINELRKTSFWNRINRIFFEADDAWYDSKTVIPQLAGDGFVEVWKTAADVPHYDVLMERNASVAS